MQKKHTLISLFIILIPICVNAQKNTFTLEGFITDEDGNSLINATVRTQNNRYVTTDAHGYYEMQIPLHQLPPILKIESRYLGKRTYNTSIAVSPDSLKLQHNITLRTLDLYMDEVSVTAEPADKNVSNSTYVIDRMAIEQSQAYTLGNLLQLIPGQTITNPNFQGAQTINFRSLATGSHQLNNGFGIGIFLNGQNLNNNASMQSLNPLSSGLSLASFGESRSKSGRYQPGVTPGGGFDLRELPVGNIEKVEVVQGVVSAKHGDLSEGGIFIETFAGQSPWNINFRRSGGELGLGVNKGFQIHPRHAVNVSVDYLNSNADRRDRVKSFNRLSTSFLWTSYYGQDRQVRNTMSLSYRQNLDDFKTDPDLGPTEITYYQDKRLSFSNRLQVQSNRWLFDTVSFSISASAGRSTSLLDEFINPGVAPVIAVKEEGVHEGTYHPASYRSQRKILGEPVSLGSQITFNRAVSVADWNFNISYGGNFNFDANYGKGRVFDPLRPVPQNRAVSRPVSYKELQPQLLQGGTFIENTIKGEIGGHQLNSSIGLRADVQHGYKTLSPRINSRFYLSNNFSLTGAYGIQTKSPGLIHLYPGSNYHDYTLLNSFTGNTTESIYLAYTRISKSISENLKPMKSYRAELGFQWKKSNYQLSTTFYHNISKNGITRNKRAKYLDLPVYEIVEQNSGQEPVIRNTGETNRTIYEQGYFTNSLYTKSWGIETTAHTPKIDVLQTSLALSLSYTNSFYYDQAHNVDMSSRNPQPSEEVWYGIYPPSKQKSGQAQAMLTSIHHISELGLLLNFRSEAFLYNYQETLAHSNRAVAYVNKETEVVPIPADEIDDPRFDVLDKKQKKGTSYQNPSFVYFNIHANVSKNISSSVRLSFFANNFLNIRPEVTDSDGAYDIYNQPPYFGMELRLTL